MRQLFLVFNWLCNNARALQLRSYKRRKLERRARLPAPDRLTAW